MRLNQLPNLLQGFVFLAFASFTSWSQCNGSHYLCTKRYNEVAYLMTHNAFNADQEGFLFPNQNVGITQQLNDGVRGLMLDVYDLNGVATVYHGQTFLGTATLQSVLAEIKVFMDANPNEIVTIILECYVSANVIESELTNAGLFSYLYTKPVSGPWDLLQDMVNTNKRLVVISDVDDAGPGQGWYHFAWDHCVETHYSVNDINAFTNDYNRGNANNDLFIFNHFVTSALTGTGLPNIAPSANDFNFLLSRIEGHFAQYIKFPNFITLDFYDLGDGMEVVDTLNSPNYVLQLHENEQMNVYAVYPNPSVSFIYVYANEAAVGKQICLLDEQGRKIAAYMLNETNTSISTEALAPGTYFIGTESSKQLHRIIKL